MAGRLAISPWTERTIPILPCRSIDGVLAFYEALGFVVTDQLRTRQAG